MRYLLDTPLISELMRARPDEWVAKWIDAFDEDEICLSILTVGEIVKSIEQLPDPKRKAGLRDWLNDELLIRFHGKIIPLDMEIIAEWGRLTAQTEAAGKPMPTIDALIAATVRARGLVLITYNVEGFAAAGIEASDPWRG